MMIALPGFKIVALLKAGVKAVIYRGIKVKDQCPVIIKGLRAEQCIPNNIEQLRHEYAIAQRLNIAAAVVVDDDADMREFLSFMLEQYGATVITVTSAIAALTALSQS